MRCENRDHANLPIFDSNGGSLAEAALTHALSPRIIARNAQRRCALLRSIPSLPGSPKPRAAPKVRPARVSHAGAMYRPPLGSPPAFRCRRSPSAGDGIRIGRSLPELVAFVDRQPTTHVVQSYVTNPYLLPGQRKFDIRCVHGARGPALWAWQGWKDAWD